MTVSDDDDDEVPNWDLLADSPAEFFALPACHDRKDLKRSYNRWLRRFKPETHPEEFSRLHAAYKDLEHALTSGATGGGLRRSASGPAPSPFPNGSDSRVSDGEVVDAAGALRNEIFVDSAEASYARRAALLAPSAKTFVELALLCDVVDEPAQEGEPSSDFLSWLMTGLRRHPGDATLRAWIACLCADRAAAPANRARLSELASALSPADFAMITEPVWREFLRCRSFGQFAVTWDECWRDNGSLGSAQHAATTLTLLPAAMWSADTAWVDQQIAWLQEDHALLGNDVDEQFGALSILRDHCAVRQEFRARGPVHERLDELIFDLTTLETEEADRRFIAWQLEAQRDGGALLEEFPPGHPDCAAAYAFLERACVAVEARIDEDGRGLPRERAVELLRASFQAIVRRTGWSALDLTWKLGGLVAWLITILTIAALVVVPDFALQSVHPKLMGVGAIVGGFFAFHLYRSKLRSMRAGFAFRGAMRCYRRIWREELVELMRRTQLPAVVVHELLHDELDDAALGSAARRYRDWMAAFLTHDVGLGVWSLANRGG